MSILASLMKRFRNLNIPRSISKALVLLISLILVASLGMFLLERGENSQFANLGDGLWWAITTVTTVGYGDRYPVTASGRLLAVMVMLGGIGSFGFIAGTMLEELVRKGQGKMSIKFNDHFVICSYNYKVPGIVNEIKRELPESKIVLIADLPENPLGEKEGVHFVRGNSAREAVLEKANIGEARTAIVISDLQMDDQLSDANSVLTVLAIKHLNPDCRVVVESQNPENSYHLHHAGADEIISVGDLSAKLLSRSSIHRGMTHLISELMSNNSGNELYSLELPPAMNNCRFEEACLQFKSRGAILIGVLSDGHLVANPPPELGLKIGCILIYIAPRRVF